MTFYAARNITPSDQLLFDAGGKLVGLQAGGTAAAPLVPRTGAERAGTSIMWLGDSLQASGMAYTNPLARYGAALYRLFPTYTNINTLGLFVIQTLGAASIAAGAGTLRYFAATREFSWQAFGQAEGPRTPAANLVWVALESGSPGSTLYLSLVQRQRPSVDAADTVTVSGNVIFNPSGFTNGFTAWASLALGRPFSKELTYAVSGISASEMLAASAQWESVYTDVTNIHLGTNVTADIATATTEVAAVEAIIKKRLAIGSRVLVGALFPYNSTTATLRGARQYFRQKLASICGELGVDHWDAWPLLASPTATDGSYRTDIDVVTSGISENIHPGPLGCMLIGVDVVAPILAKYVPPTSANHMPGVVYDATLAPYGNLLTNGTLTGAVAAVGPVTGTVPTSWTVARGVGAVMAIASTAPQDGSPVARADGVPGNWWRVAVNNTGGVNGESAVMSQTTAISAANIAVGDYIVLEGEYRLAGSGIRGIDFQGYRAKAVESVPANTMLDLAGRTVQHKFRSRPILVESGFGTVNVVLTLFMLANGIATLDFGPISFHKVPAPV